jgi:TRAP-type C4-dicarboxylate transport system permease small subunit
LGVGPINGDFELVEAGMAFAIFAFLPLCQLNGAHAKVDVFTSKLPDRVMRVLNTVIELVFAIVLIIIAYQLFQGTVSKRGTGQTTFLLEFPIWWSYAVSVCAAIVAAAIAVYVAVMRLTELLTGATLLPPDMEADH